MGNTTKKTILYNTHMFALINNTEQYFKKLRSVFDTFKNRDDVVLWWRPHPNTEVNIRQYRPELLKEYLDIVENYKQEGWGIYDDTPDLHRAIACTDAYYGDMSSLVALYQATGKPCMLQNVELTDSQLALQIAGLLLLDDGIWATVKSINALIKLDKQALEPEFIGSFPDECPAIAAWRNSPMYSRPAESEGNLFFPPYFAQEIAMYSRKDKSFGKAGFEEQDRPTEDKHLFCDTFIHEDNVFFAPHFYPAIVSYNTVTEKVTHYDDWLNPLKKLVGDTQEPAFFGKPCAVGNTIWLPVCGANAVVEFNMETCSFAIHEVGGKGCRYGAICYDGKNLWLSPRHCSPLVKWNPSDGATKEFEDLLLSDKNVIVPFVSCVCCSGYVWLIPYNSENAIKIDISTDTLSIAEEFRIDYKVSEAKAMSARYSFAQAYDDCIYAYNDTTEELVIYDCAEKKRKEATIECSRELEAIISPLIVQSLIADLGFENESGSLRYYGESKTKRLKEFIDFIISEDAYYADSNKYRVQHKTPQSGEAIFKYAVSLI